MTEKVNILITLNGFGNSIKTALSEYIEKQDWAKEVRLISVIPTTTMREQSLKGIMYNEIMPDRTIDDFSTPDEVLKELNQAEIKPAMPEVSQAPTQIVEPVEQPEELPKSIGVEKPKPFKIEKAPIKEEVKEKEVTEKVEELKKPKSNSIF